MQDFVLIFMCAGGECLKIYCDKLENTLKHEGAFDKFIEHSWLVLLLLNYKRDILIYGGCLQHQPITAIQNTFGGSRLSVVRFSHYKKES